MSEMKRRFWRSTGSVLAAGLLTLALVALQFAASRPAIAQPSQDAAANFMNPFPENEVWRGLVIGDYLAEGLLAGLSDAMANEQRLQLQRRHRPLQSLLRPDLEDDAKALEDLVTKEKIHIAVVMLGMADRGGIRLLNGRRLPVGQGDWRTQYAQRVDRVVRMLRRKGVAVYWVGLPITRRFDWNDDIEEMNSVFRERALNAGAKYIDAFKESADENGQFSDRGPDLQGKVVRLRDPEGQDFTPAGYRKLAFFIERQMKRDMTAAREERTIPLAGSEAEQKRINPDAARLAASGAAAGAPVTADPQQRTPLTARDARAAASPVVRALSPAAPVPQETEAPGGELKADNVRVSFKTATGGKEEQVTIEIVRPALTQSVIQLMTRRDRGDRPSQVGDTLTDTLSNGLLVMRSVTPSRSTAERTASRGVLTQQPFFIALAKGERLPPKPGRADDFRWPREDDIPPPPVPAAAPSIASPVPLAQPSTPRQQRASQRVRPQPERPPMNNPFQP